MSKLYKLLDSEGKEYLSEEKGTLGGHRKLRIYGRLDCPSALRYIEKGQYVNIVCFLLMRKQRLPQGTDHVPSVCPMSIRNGRKRISHKLCVRSDAE